MEKRRMKLVVRRTSGFLPVDDTQNFTSRCRGLEGAGAMLKELLRADLGACPSNQLHGQIL
jgi:hypothetical protein